MQANRYEKYEQGMEPKHTVTLKQEIPGHKQTHNYCTQTYNSRSLANQPHEKALPD